MNLICFDLEGPLSPQDNAYDLMKLFPDGQQVFEIISRYDDLLALEGKEGYEPGDTLALIVPFLVRHSISEDDIRRLAQRATLVAGAPELIAALGSRGWKVFCISTSFEQYATLISQRVGIARDNLACTRFPLNRYSSSLCKDDSKMIGELETSIITLRPVDNDREIKQRLDRFFWQELGNTGIGRALAEIKPVGGQRKVEALKRFARDSDQPLSNFVVVGDSITDARMLDAVNNAGGLAVAFNANEYALPYATIGLASANLGDLRLVTDAWERGGRPEIEAAVKEKERRGGRGDRDHFHWLLGRKDLDEPLQVHRRMRRLVREEAGKLG